jgi:hypothetical protein
MNIEDRNKLLAEIEAVYRAKRVGHVSWVCKKFTCSRDIARSIIAKLKAGQDIEEELNEAKNPPAPKTEVPAIPVEDDSNQAIINMGGYTWNRETDTYVVPLKSYGREFIMTGANHRALADAYSRWNGGPERTVEEIGLVYNMTPDMVKEYVKTTGIKRDAAPVTKEELLQDKGPEAVKRLIQQRRLAFEQELQHTDWKTTQEDAKKWRDLECGKLNPFERFLENHKPAPIEPLDYTLDTTKEVKNVFLLGLSDIHFGAEAKGDELFFGKDYNAAKIAQIIDDYSKDIAHDLNDRKYRFERCVIAVVGDILHSLTGFTAKGTMLEADVLREEQFELAFDCLNRFINRMHELFGKVEIQVVKGNHAGASEYLLFYALKNFYKDSPSITFNLHKKRSAVFRVLKTCILLDHGESDFVKAKVPKTAVPREAFIQKHMMEYPDLLQGATSRIMIQGDLHHFEHIEYSNVEFFMFGSAVCGDRYADHLSLNSRPRQNCLIISDQGVKEVLHYYFD